MKQAPVAIRSSATQATMAVEWGQGQVAVLAHGRLRAGCPCSKCRAALLAQRIDAAPDGIRITAVHAQGYGVQLVSDGGHERGIYPWELFARAVE